MTEANPTHRYPVRDPAGGPVVILNLPDLWAAVAREMERRGITEDKQLSELTGIDRTTLGRVRRRARNGEIVRGQRGGVSANAVLTLASFAANGQTVTYGLELRGGIPPFYAQGGEITPPATVAPATVETTTATE